LADRLAGDELLRLTAARIATATDGEAPTTAVSALQTLVQTWRSVVDGTTPLRSFSQKALLQALRPPDPDRLAALLTDYLTLQPAEVREILGIENAGAAARRGREQLTTPDDASALIIEDEPLIAANLARILEGIGIRTSYMAPNATAAISRAKAEPPDITFADFHLEGGSTGMEAVLGIREFAPGPVIFVTGDPDQLLKGEEYEPDFVIAKPFHQQAIEFAALHALDAKLHSRNT
jgi:CheY-like chemotaxis protein